MLDSINPIFFLGFPILVFSVCLHEFSHALTADWAGDDTPRSQGRITLNPVSHVDPIGTIIVPIVAMLMGLPLIGWPRPVLVNYANVSKRSWIPIINAAGPMSNFLLAIVAAVIGKVISLTVGLDSVHEVVPIILGVFISINVMLGILNMLPVPGLDGGNLLYYFVIRRSVTLNNAWEVIGRYPFLILYLIIILKPTRYFLFTLFSAVSGALLDFMK